MNLALRQYERTTMNPKVQVASVDIFDTILLRTTTPEKNRFKTFGKQQLEALRRVIPHHNITCKQIQLMRIYAAKIAYRNRPQVQESREATLDEIYNILISTMKNYVGITDDQIKDILPFFREIEIQLEIESLHINKQIYSILQQTKNSHKKVVAISDMYLSYQDIVLILRAKGILDLFDNIYVSSEFGYGKASGSLFDTALSEYGIMPCQLTHIGDNWFSDFYIPNKKGITSFYYPRSFLWRVTHKARSYASTLIDGNIEWK